jgi:hypothetical protein
VDGTMIMRGRDYPENVRSLIDTNMKFKPEVLRACRQFARSRPWRGTREQRCEKFRNFNYALALAYNVSAPKLVFGGHDGEDSGRSCFIPALDTIILRGRLSVITILHEWGHKRFGRNEARACRWSVNLFRRVFPASFARLRFDGHMCRAVQD